MREARQDGRKCCHAIPTQIKFLVVMHILAFGALPLAAMMPCPERQGAASEAASKAPVQS